MDADGRVFGVLSTAVTGPGCTLDNPCELDASAANEEQSSVTSYGAPVAGLRGCFSDGVFEPSTETCFLALPPLPDPERGVRRYTPPIVNGVTPHWDAALDDELPYYRFKTGPGATTHCDEADDYGPIVSVASAPLIEAEITDEPGTQVLCVHGGTGEDISTFTPLRSAAALLTAVDTTPPPSPLPVVARSGGELHFAVRYPDYMRFYYRVQSVGESDCQRRPSDDVVPTEDSLDYADFLVLGTAGEPTSYELCVTAEDAAGNLTTEVISSRP